MILNINLILDLIIDIACVSPWDLISSLTILDSQILLTEKYFVFAVNIQTSKPTLYPGPEVSKMRTSRV